LHTCWSHLFFIVMPRLLSAVVGAFGLVAVVASAQDVRTVYAPIAMPTNAQTGELRTTACLQLTERVYPSTRWWENVNAAAPAIDRAFKSVISAIHQKDRAMLLELTDPAQAGNTTEFDRRSSGYFQQFQSIQLLSVPRAYEFDGLVVFFGKFQSSSQTAFIPLVFAHEGDNTFRFLPSRTSATTFTLVNDWFAPSGLAAVDVPAYCSDSDVKRATHRVSLVSSRWRQSSLLLSGATVNAKETQSAIGTQVQSTIGRMKAAFKGSDFDGVFNYMTPEGAGSLKRWLSTATATERDRYKTAFIEQQPFFVFDASPLLVVYTRMRTGEIRVLYFKVTPDKDLLWGNSSYLAGLVDRVYERGPLLAAANSARPFSILAIK